MDQSKYIIQIALLIFAISCILRCQTTLADAWLPKPGTYKYVASIAFIDQDTREFKKQRQILYNDLQDVARMLGRQKDAILTLAQNNETELMNSEKRALAIIDHKIATLLAEAKYLAIFNESEFGNFAVEQGINENQSFGVSIGYRLDQFATYFDDGKSWDSFCYGNDIQLIYKHKLYSNNKLIITLKQQVQFDKYQNNQDLIAATSIMFGYAITKKNGQTIFQDIGVSMAIPTANNINQAIEITDGIKFKNGIIISNYLRYSFAKKEHIADKHTLYEQIAIGKVIGVGNLKKLDLTAQLGYFWHRSLSDTKFMVSGPTVSLWFNI
jgi:hypothetical protein